MIDQSKLENEKIKYCNDDNKIIAIHHSPYFVDFRSAGCYHTITGRLQIATRAARQAFRVASLLAGSTSSRPFFCFLCNLRSIHDAQGTDARPCEVSHRYVKCPMSPSGSTSRTARPKIITTDRKSTI